jgi:hypothetical protein
MDILQSFCESMLATRIDFIIAVFSDATVYNVVNALVVNIAL